MKLLGWAACSLWIAWAGAGAAVRSQTAPSAPEAPAKQALDHFYNLEYDPAIALFEKLRDAEPKNPSWHNRVAVAYFYKQLHVAGILQGDLFGSSNQFFRTRKIQMDPRLQKGFADANEAAIRLCEERLKRDKKDQEALYACGAAYATRATYEGLIERSRLGFLESARKANNYHSELLQLNPKFYDAYLVPGIFDFVLGSLPGPLKVLFYLAGLSGDKERGMRAVESTARWGERTPEDAKIILTVMYRREKRFAEARRVLGELAEAYPRNYIVPLEIASLFRAAEEKEQAIEAYAEVLERVRRGWPGYQEVPAARVHYELGMLHRQIEELENARKHFLQVAGAKGSNPELEKESALLAREMEEALRQENAAPGERPASENIARQNPAEKN